MYCLAPRRVSNDIIILQIGKLYTDGLHSFSKVAREVKTKATASNI